MKQILLVATLIISFSCSAQESTNYEINLDDSIIAKWENARPLFSVDTLRLKTLLEKNIPDVFKFKIKSLSIIKGQTTGDRVEDFYLLIATDSQTNQKAGKSLTLQDGNLKFTHDSVFDRLIVVCSGKSLCNPNVIIVNSQKSLICGEPKECLIPGTCTMSKILPH